RNDRALQPHHPANEGVDKHKKRELLPVRTESESDPGHGLARTHSAASSLPELMARTSAACSGGAGMSASITRRKSASSSMRNALLNRFSNPMVDVGLPLRLRPQTDPE